MAIRMGNDLGVDNPLYNQSDESQYIYGLLKMQDAIMSIGSESFPLACLIHNFKRGPDAYSGSTERAEHCGSVSPPISSFRRVRHVRPLPLRRAYPFYGLSNIVDPCPTWHRSDSCARNNTEALERVLHAHAPRFAFRNIDLPVICCSGPWRFFSLAACKLF